MGYYDGKMQEFIQKRQLDRLHFVENLRKTVLPAQIKRIQQNDKGVLKDLVLPEWLDWDLLYEWAMRFNVIENPRECVLCNSKAELGIDFNQKFICERCFFRVKVL
ncbi:Uncharacterised protein [uncultured archaeon]|nr:Uncharacterised protein [uncultured archaeon]